MFLVNLCTLIFVAFAGWLPIGVVNDGIYWTTISSTADFDSEQNPVVAYVGLDFNQHGYNHTSHVKRWNGTDWEEYGSYLDTKRLYNAKAPVVAVDADDTIYVAFYESRSRRSGIYDLMVKQWDGASWKLVGIPLNSDTNNSSSLPAIIIDQDNAPIVAFYEYLVDSSTWNLHVKKWDGTEWTPFGDIAEVEIDPSGSRPGLIMNYRNNPVISFKKDEMVFVSRWNGRRWVRNGDALNANIDNESFSITLAVGSSGRIFASWYENDPNRGGYAVHVSQWRGQNGWQSLSTINDSIGIMRAWQPSIAVRGKSVPTISWTDFDTKNIYVSYYSRKKLKWLTYHGRPVDHIFGVTSEVYFDGAKTHVLYTRDDKQNLLVKQK